MQISRSVIANASSPDAADAARMAASPSTCPLCGGPNGCAMNANANADVACWCMQVDIDADSLQRANATGNTASCICAACAMGSRPDERP
jgi:hypothetical protein